MTGIIKPLIATALLASLTLAAVINDQQSFILPPHENDLMIKHDHVNPTMQAWTVLTDSGMKFSWTLHGL